MDRECGIEIEEDFRYFGKGGEHDNIVDFPEPLGCRGDPLFRSFRVRRVNVSMVVTGFNQDR